MTEAQVNLNTKVLKSLCIKLQLRLIMMTIKCPALLVTVTSLLLPYCCANFGVPIRVIGVFKSQIVRI